ncbi:MAG: Trm112 family protein [Pseudomonadota bacterium]|nr:Trm112 family protein [Pseudomonadota bacterium]HCD64034.1 hypothetical protein [Alphaproteobacteria bacterium]
MMNKVQNTDRNLLSLLVCPVSLSGLIYDRQEDELVSLRSRLAFPVQDGVPIMLEQAARPLTDDDYTRLTQHRPSSPQM